MNEKLTETKSAHITLATKTTSPSSTNNIILRIKIARMIKIWKKMVKKSKHRINILKEWEAT